MGEGGEEAGSLHNASPRSCEPHGREGRAGDSIDKRTTGRVDDMIA